MAKNLIIVESPAKGPTIKRFLGNDYKILASMGHIRDLPEKSLGVDVKKNYEPEYRINRDKQKIIKELKDAAESADSILLATDEDREGEAISWHLSEALQLPAEKTQRIVFHEITKSAIENAIKNPRPINYHLVDAQQARRILDRLVGFELSPLLWRKVMPKLSAGRVQSVAVRLIVDRENEINSFSAEDFYKVTAFFLVEKKKMKAEVIDNFANEELAEEFLKDCLDATFTVKKIEKKPGKKSPPPPFTTSTLQQEASRRLGFTVAKTMLVAQQLYEAGKITYMRTDSVNLSSLALSTAQKEIIETHGKKYYKRRQYSTKSRGAQEAHEAIRPTYISQEDIEGTRDQQKLYTMIRKRTLASQMADALLEKTTVTVDVSTRKEDLIARGEILSFDGFLKIMGNSKDSKLREELLPVMEKGQELDLKEMIAAQRYSQQPSRYNEAMLVRKLEELGIGRPSTYAPIISTIQKRKYVEKLSKPAEERQVKLLRLKNKKIEKEIKKEKFNAQVNKLFPTDIGIIVNKFLVMNFADILDYNFTASVEEEFDKIADGEIQWQEMIDRFYKPFHFQVERTGKEAPKVKGMRKLGEEPDTGKPVYARLGKFGPMIQIGEAEDEEKPRFASLRKNQSLETISLEEALKLFAYPIELGKYKDEKVLLNVGRYGPYIKHGKKNYSIDRREDISKINLSRAKEIILEQKDKKSKKLIKEFKADSLLQVLDGRYGAYISYKKNNYRIPKDFKAEDLSLEDCQKIITDSPKKSRKKKKKS